MYCKNCGSQIRDQATFCPNCGTPTQNAPNPSTNTPTPPTMPQYVQPNVPPNQQPYMQPTMYQNPQPYAQPIPNQNMYVAPAPTSKWNLPWLPIVLAVVSFVFSCLGGDVDLNEINVFDWIAALFGVVSFASVFFTIPSNRKTLKIVSIIITAFMALAMVGYLLPA